MHFSTVWYYPVNNGDGSCSVLFFSTQEKALEYRRLENDNGNDWAENCVDCIKLHIQDGNITSDEFDPER